MDAIDIVGAGGIGCAVGYALLATGADVRFVESDRRKTGSTFVGVAGQPNLPASFVAFADWYPSPSAIVILCTKCYDNTAVLARISAGIRLLPIQNGFDAELDARGHDAEGIASFVSECPAGSTITNITRNGDLHLGARGGIVPNWLAEFASHLRLARLFRVVEVTDVRPIKYAKLLYNAAISPLAAAAGLDNGKLLSNALARRLFFAFLKENYAILDGAKIPLGKVGPFHPATVNRILSQTWLARLLAFAFEPGLRGTYCSMSSDLSRGRTEIANYNEHLVHLAGDRPCPLNRRAVEVIRRMERERIAPHVDALKWFETQVSRQ